MSKIIEIKSREILDSRGTPTVETDVITEEGGFGRCSVPSGMSTGIREAIELRDEDESRYHGNGVLKAVRNVNKIIAPKLIGIDVLKQELIDNIMIELDDTINKSNLGANAILSVSIACLKAAADEMGLELYEYLGDEYDETYPMMNILNGGAHANNNLDFQEFMIIPVGTNISERIRMGSEIFHSLKELLNDNGFSTSVGDEGGFAPDFKSNEEALDYIIGAIERAGYKAKRDVFIALDVAATQFYNKKTNKYKLNGFEFEFDRENLINYYKKLIDKYPIISIEDPVEENDFEGFKLVTEKLGDKIQLVGDDLFVTNEKLLQKGIDMDAGNAIIIKLNQIGTVTEALKTINLAKDNNYKTIISNRSGETEDTFIADLAVGLNLGQIKTGSLSRIDRVAKYNRLMRIEEEIKEK